MLSRKQEVSPTSETQYNIKLVILRYNPSPRSRHLYPLIGDDSQMYHLAAQRGQVPASPKNSPLKGAHAIDEGNKREP